MSRQLLASNPSKNHPSQQNWLTKRLGILSLPTKHHYRPLLSIMILLLFGLSFSGQAQIAQRGSSTTNATNGATSAMTINKPTGVVAGDVLIATIVQNETDNDNGGLTNVTSTGWTLIDGNPFYTEGTFNGQNAYHGTVLYRVADGTEGSSFSFSLPNSRADMAMGAILAFSGVNATGGVKADGTAGGPFDVDPGILNLASSPTATATAVTSASANAGVLMIAMNNGVRTYSSWAATNPTSLTELLEYNTTNFDDASVGAAWALRTTAGSTGNGTVNIGIGTRNAAMFLILKSACPIPNTVGLASSTPTLCVNTALTNITHTTSTATGIGTPSGLPAGVSAAFASNTITISGTPTAAGTFSYSIPLTGGCGAALNATGTITVNASPTVGASANNTTVCTGGTIDLTATTNISGNFVAGEVNFENSSTYTVVGGSTRTGTSASGDRPASESFVTSPSTSYSAINTTATITTQNFSGLPSGATKTISMRLAAFSIGSTTNGMDNSDVVTVSISLDGGSTYSREIWVQGGLNGSQNSYWGFTSGTGVASVTYDGNDTPLIFMPGAGGARTTDGYSTLAISLPTSATQVRVKVTMVNNSTNESWVIDDIKLTQSIVPTYSWTSAPAGFTSSLQNPTGVAVSGNTSYTLTATNSATGCSNTSSVSVTTTAAPNAGTLSGTQNICAAGTTTFSSNGNAGGAWTSDATGVATVNSSTGLVTGVGSGTATITYTVTGTGGCANATATRTVTVTAAPNAGTVSGTQTICAAGTTTFSSNGVAGGAWSSNATGVATVNSSTGLVTGVGSGTATITYTVTGTGGCANATATRTVTVTAAPNAGTLSGTQNICAAGTSTFSSNGNAGGAWTSDAAGIATVNISSGVVTGVAAGTATITYTVTGTGGCANATATRTVTVTAAPNAGTLSGTQNICAAGTTTFSSNGNAGGAWTSGATGIATVNISTGVITGVAPGTANITYTITGTGGCANATATRTVTVAPNNTVGTASSTPTVCINTALTSITHTTTGATGIANAGTAGANGLPAGVAASWNSNTITIFGTPSVSGTFGYSIPLLGGCGTVNATGTITVSPANTVGLSSALGTDAQTVCNNTAIGTIQYIFNGLSGITGANVTGLPSGINGVYSGSPKSINIDGSTTQTGTFNYTVTSTGGVCSAISASGTITISPTTVAGTVAGSSTVCTGINSTTLTLSGQTGNVIKWQSSPVGSFASGVVDISNTTTTLTASNLTTTTFYRAVVVSGACASQNSASASVTVSPVSVGGSISGSTTVCTGTNVTLLTLSGHTGSITRWESSLDNFATAGTPIANTNTTFAPSNLTATTYYRAVITSSPCASVYSATATITVTPTNTVTLSSAVGTNAQTKCINTAITDITYATTTATGATFSGLPAGVNGNWTSNVATISGTPTASGPFTYFVTLTGGCGSVNISGTITVTPASVGGTIAGSTSRCAGTNSTTLTLSGHTGAITRWESSLDNFATAGTSISNTTTTLTATNLPATTYYRAVITNGVCAAANSATATITVNPRPVIASKTETICSGQAFSVTPVNGTDIVPAGTTYTWIVLANASVTGETNQASPQSSISQTLTNTTNTVQNVVYTVTPTSPTGSCVGSTFTVTVTVNPTPVIANKTATICSGSTFSISPTNGGAEIVPAGSVYSWTVVDNTNLTGEASGNDLSTISGTLNNLSNSNQTLVYTVVPTSGAAGFCDGASFTVTVTVIPTSVGGSISGSTTVCSGTNSTVLTLSGHTGAITRWESSLDNFATAGTVIANTTTTLTATNLPATRYYRAVITSGSCAAANSATATITVNPPTPAQPGAITGTATQCPALASQTYSIGAVTNATSYNWTVPAGWSITANTGTSITVTTGTAGQNGNISVTAQNSCGTSTARTLAVTVSNAAPAVPTAAAGSNVACTSISANWTASANATAYFLDVSTVNTFATFEGVYNNLNVGNVTTRSVTGLTAGVTYFYRVRANNSCGTSASSSVITYATSSATPAQPGAITGTTNLCAAVTGQIYSISAVANASTYNWTVPTGWTITAGAGTTTITVTAGAGGQDGNISVTSQNSCGTSSARTLAVTVTPNPTVDVGPGLAAICQGGVSANLGGNITSPATVGTWSTTSGGTFSPNATTLNATWTPPAAFVGTATLTLTSSGGSCGIATGSKNITINPLPANAGAITGTATVCQGQSGVVYSIAALANATSYTWSYSGTGFTASGTTASIFGSFSASATSGILTVRGVNACGNGVASANYAITINSVPSASGAITGSPSLCQGQTGVAFSVAPIAGATSYLWSYTGTGFTPSGTTASITANFSASATAGVLTVRGVNSCGNGVASANYSISVAQLPGTPGTILGPSTVCKGQAGFSFTIPAIANATSYNWQYTGTGVTFSGNTNLVTITVSNTATSGSIRVRGVSACLNGPWSADLPLTIINAPTVSITSNYCGTPGFVILTASSGFTNYLWSTGANTSFINADIAGQYTVTVANSFGCMATASVGVATELVTNGSFDAGNTGFTTNYTYVADGAGQTEMYPEGTYAVVPNANPVHNLFWGTGHTPSGGNYMVVNGSPALGQNVWSQNNITVQPNTTYYFSAWGLSVVNGNNAVLRFSINGSQVGSIASLPNGYTSTAGPFNWVRFYGSWNSGFATEADLSIINLNTILGGNDFGLDDVSFGTLSPVALSVSPSTIIGTTVCQGNELVLNANAVGGASPFTYQWSGPNGFTSTVMNPSVTASAAAVHAGTYTLTVTDGFGCTASSNVTITISALPLDKTPVATTATVCVNGNSSITIASSQTGVSYQLRNDADDSPVGDPVAGTGGTISFPVDNLSATTTYNVLATGALTQCSAEMSNTVTVTVATTPVLSITNQAVCSGTVNLTAAAVTAGSTGSGILSYWTNATATTALATPTSVAASGVYYIKSTVGSCVDIEPVTVSISTTPITGFTYPGTPYCSTELDPTATMNANAVAGVFTSLTAGLVFSNTATGTIDLSASTAGTYTVRNTVSPTGGCPSVNSTSTVVITGAPLTDFSYDAGNDFCQVYSAVNPSPVFGPGAAAGTFASTFGLNFVSTSTGVVNLATSTPGNYAIWNTRPAIGGCAAESDTVFIDINPYVFAGSVNTSVSDDIVCLGETVDLFSQTTAYSSVLLRERFNGTINNWVRGNSSVGGTVANAAWTLRASVYNYNGNNYSSNDNTQFYMSNSQAQAGTTTLTTLRSPVMSTVGYTNLNLDFFHYFDARNSGDTALVQVSLNNLSWTTVATYTNNDEGNRTAFTNPVINLNAYIGQPIFYVRFRYRATDDRQWAIDNVSLTGNCTKYFYDWASAPAGFSSTSANPLNVLPPQNSFYVVDATNTFGCSNPSSPLPVTVNALPILTSSLTPPAVCGNEIFTYVPASTPSSALISWTRPTATGITNAAITAAQSGNPSETLENLTNSDKNVIYNFSLDNNGCSQVVPVTVAVKPIPVIDLGTNLSVCNGSPAQLNTTITNGLNVDNYSWSPSTGLNSTTISDPTATVTTASQSYTVTVQTTNGCSNTSSSITVSNQGFGGTAGLWLGTINNNWDDCRNWADGKIPTNTTNVTVDGNALNDIQITGSQQCNNLLFLSNNNTTRTITLIANSTLTANGNVAVTKSNGTGTITLRVMNNATLTCNNLSIAGTVNGAGNAIVQKDMVNTVINVNGSLSIDPGAHLDLNDGNNGTSEGTMSIKGNFVNNGNAADFNVGNVEVIFNGNALQTITCPATQDFGNVTLDNSSVAGVRLNNNIAISRGMQFINGLLDLNQRTLTLGSSTANAAITGSGNNSYILAWDGSDNGTVIQQVNNLGFNYLFPIGDLNEYTPFTVNLSSATLSNATLTAKLNATANPNIVGSTNYLGRYWSIEPSGITNPLYSVQYNYAAVDIFGSEAFLFPAKYNSGGWQSCMESASNAMIGNGSINAGSNTLTWSGITTFSEFTAIGNGTPLPIELLDFTAEPTSKVVNLKWITASETNNSHFTVERSSDGVVFKPVLEKPGAGNSNSVRSYSDVDENPLEGVSYYRLKQTDFNGEFSYSEWVVVNFIGDQKVSLETVFADRSTGNVFFRCNNPENQNININIFDAAGKMIHSSSQFSSASNWSGSVNMGSLSKGSYIVRVSIAGQMLHGKFVY